VALAFLLAGCAAPAPSTPTAAASLTPLPVPTATLPATTVPATSTAAPSARPTVDAAALDNYLLSVEKLGLFSGAVLVARDGQVLLDKGYGLADATQNLPNTPKTKFLIGSVTKQFTAMAILMLEAQGKVHVPDSICTYLPDCPALWQPITLQELLTHSSGITNYTSLESFQSLVYSQTTSAQMVQLIRDQPLDFAPGTQWAYSNSNYLLLGLIVERVSGQSYGDFLQQHVLGPLGMTDTGYGPWPADLAVGYLGVNNPVRLWDPSTALGAGGLYSTAEDLYRWDQALYTERLLPRAALDRMFSAQMPTGITGESYGYGWGIDRDHGHLVISHNGSLPGFTAEIARYVDDHLTIIVLSNRQDGNPTIIRQALAAKVLGE
jgi:CubicO group peptidase (beta-lactamase class C family)